MNPYKCTRTVIECMYMNSYRMNQCFLFLRDCNKRFFPQSSTVCTAFVEFPPSRTTYCQVPSRRAAQHLHAVLKMIEVLLYSFSPYFFMVGVSISTETRTEVNNSNLTFRSMLTNTSEYC